jgi:hypothetical protein
LTGATSIKFEESLDGTGWAELEVSANQVKRNADAANMTVTDFLDPGSVELVLTFGGEEVFCGPITEVEWETGAAVVRIVAKGLMHYFANRIVASDVDYVAEDFSDIVAFLVDDSQAESYGDLAIVDSTTPCGTNGTISFTAGKNLLEAIGEVTGLVGAPEVWIDAARELHAEQTRGTDNRARVRITSGMADVALWRARSESIVTVARVTGADDGNGGTYMGSYESSTGLATYGRVAKTYKAPQLLSNAECVSLAQRIVESAEDTTPALTLSFYLTPVRPFNFADIGIGDVIDVSIEDRYIGRIVGPYRIVNRRAELVDEALGTYAIELDVEPARLVGGRWVGSRSRHNPAVFTQLKRLELDVNS